MAITVTLTSTQAALMSMTVLVLNGAAASPEGAWAASTSAPEAAVTPLASGSLIVGCAALHYPADPPGFLSPDAGTVLDLDSQSIRNEALAWHASAAAVAGVPVTTGAPNSGLFDDRAAVALEVLPAGGGPVTIDASSPPPLPGPAVQNSALSTGGTITTRTSASFTPPPGAVLAVLGTNSFGPGSTLIASESGGTYTWVRDAAATGSNNVAMALLGIPPAPPPSGTGLATVTLSAAGSGAKRASGTGTAAVTLAGPGSGSKRAAGTGTAAVALSAAGITAAATPQIVAGSRTLMIAAAVLSQQGWAHRLPDVQAGQPVWVNTRQAADLVASGLAFYAPAATPLPPAEPPWTVAQMPGAGAGTTNTSH